MKVAIAVLAMSCAPQVSFDVDLKYAEGRAARQTNPAQIQVVETDLAVPYYVLADLEVTVSQRSSFGDIPTKTLAVNALREQAARIGAHAVVLTAFGQEGMGAWSSHELKGHGRAVRFR